MAAHHLDPPRALPHSLLTMPLPQKTLAQLSAIVAPDKVLTALEDIIPYSFDGTAAMQQLPACVVFARTVDQIVKILQLANETHIAIVTRGSGTGLSGGSLPLHDS